MGTAVYVLGTDGTCLSARQALQKVLPAAQPAQAMCLHGIGKRASISSAASGPSPPAMASVSRSAKRSSGCARLARAQELAGPADLQVAPGDLEAVGGLAHRGFSRSRAVAEQRRRDTAARRPMAAAPRPTRPRSWCSWRQAEALGMLDHHQRGVGHVHPDLDHRGGRPAPASGRRVKAPITAAFSAAGMRAVHQADRAGPAARRPASRASRSRSAGAAPRDSSISGQTQ